MTAFMYVSVTSLIRRSISPTRSTRGTKVSRACCRGRSSGESDANGSFVMKPACRAKRRIILSLVMTEAEVHSASP